MALDWPTLQTAVLAALVQSPSPYTSVPQDFTVLLPFATAYAEQRITRDIVLLATRTQDSSLSTSSGYRLLTLTGMTKQVVEPETLALTVNGQRVPFHRCSLAALDEVWPAVTGGGINPTTVDPFSLLWDMVDDHTIAIGPAADAPYAVVITGLFAAQGISQANPVTYISTYMPDLLFAGTMQHLTGTLLRNFGSQADDPRMAMSWETQYQTLIGPAKADERRRRGLVPEEPPVPAAKQ